MSHQPLSKSHKSVPPQEQEVEMLDLKEFRERRALEAKRLAVLEQTVFEPRNPAMLVPFARQAAVPVGTTTPNTDPAASKESTQ